jgi:hypothetical protein
MVTTPAIKNDQHQSDLEQVAIPLPENNLEKAIATLDPNESVDIDRAKRFVDTPDDSDFA